MPVCPPPASAEVGLILAQEVSLLLQKEAIEFVLDPLSPGFYGRLFVVPKASGGWRPVLDLSALNVFLRKCPFRMETPVSVRDSLRLGDWATSIDLTDAYFHIRIHRSCRKWLRFVWNGRAFQFRALPFGLSLAPWVFTRIVRELCLFVRSKGIRIRAYLDDWLILATSRSLCQAHTRLLLDVSDRLGFLINRRKSDLCPAQSFTYLGMVFDTVSFTVRPSLPRVLKLQSLLSSLLKKEFASARTLTSLLGMMESLAGLLPLGRLHKREFQRQLLLRWSQSSQGWDVLIPLSPWLLLSTTRWLDSEWFLIGVPIILPPPEVELFTDASSVGWGAHLDRLTTSGLWSANQALHHINWLELKAVCLALPVLVAQTAYRHVRLRTDNTTVACYVNKQGGARSPVLSRLAENLLLWCQNNNICLSALHVAGASNIIADQLSRPHLILQSEWTLVPQVLEPVWRIWFRPMVDLFATMFNHRLPVYVSPVPDPNAWRIDAFSCLWSGLLIYAFPPWSVLGRVLRKARVEKARLILIAPLWPAQAWYPDLLELSHVPPLRLQLRDRSLIQPRSGIPHGNVGLLNLHAWLLCGPNCSHGVLPLRR